MSKRKEPESGRSPVANRITRSRSSPTLNSNESSLDIEYLSEGLSHSAPTVDASENRSSAFRNSKPIPPGNLISPKCQHASYTLIFQFNCVVDTSQISISSLNF